MAYKFSKGEREFGDIEFEDDADGNTKINFEEDYIALQTGGNNALVVSGSSVGIGTANPTATLTLGGSLALNVTYLNAGNDPGNTYSVGSDDCVILINTRPSAQGGINSTLTLTLPDAGANPGRVIVIKDAAGYSNVNSIVINVSSGDNIGGNPSVTSISLPSADSFKQMISDGADSWYEIGN